MAFISILLFEAAEGWNYANVVFSRVFIYA
jgi:hypothetical protein